MQVLGEDGSVKILSPEGNTIGLVTKASNIDENGDFIIKYLNDVSQIVIQTSKPVAEGNLIINNKKAITGSLPYTKSEIESFVNLSTSSSLWQREVNEKEFFKTEEASIKIPFEETKTKARLTINKEKLSTLVLNEDVEFKIELGNNSESSDLYVDPMFDIELPIYIQDIEIKSQKILYDDELIIKNVEKIQNSNGRITLRVKLDGIQTKFSTGTITNGTNIIINTNVKVNILTPNIEDSIKMYYYNLNTTNFDNVILTENGVAGLAIAPIAYAAPIGMLSVSNWRDFDTTGRYAMSVNQGPVLAQIEIYKPSIVSQMDMLLVNNTGSVCDDISMLVRIPFKGNKTVVTEEDLGTTRGCNFKKLYTATRNRYK